MHRFISYIALFLLLLFGRAMVPDSLMLRLHNHGHTIHLPQQDQKQPHIEKKHSHCAVEDIFDAPFQPSLQLLTFARFAHTPQHTTGYYAGWQKNFLSHVDLRGPPPAQA